MNSTKAASPVTRQKQKMITQEAIMEASIIVFANNGYDGTNFREITKLSGVKRSLILYHFKSKEHLWGKAVQTVADRFSEVMSAYLEQLKSRFNNGSDEDELRLGLNAFLNTLEEIPEYGKILLREGTTEGPRLDWLAKHATPSSAIGFRLKNKDLDQKITRSIVRDILLSTLLSIITLAPLLDASLAAAIHKTKAGIHPLSKKRKAELVDYMVKLVL